MNGHKQIDALRRYRELPPEGLATVQAVMALMQWGRTTTWRKIRDGEFPAPIHVGRFLRWRKADIEEFLMAGLGQEGGHDRA